MQNNEIFFEESKEPFDKFPRLDPEAPTIVVCNHDGKTYNLKFKDGKLDAWGDLPLTEAATIFFEEVKRIAGVGQVRHENKQAS